MKNIVDGHSECSTFWMNMITLPKYIKPKLLCSFSGGRTSGYMSYWIKENLSSVFDIKYVFANTGQEHEKTLEFVNNCDKGWGLNLVWLESRVVPGKGNGTSFSVTSFNEATRGGAIV